MAEAELIEAMNAVQQSAGMAELVAELQGAKPQVKLFVDNTATIGLCTDAAGSWKTRHLRVRAHHLREAVRACELVVKHILGLQQLADLGTKAFDGPRLLELLELWKIGRWLLVEEAEADAQASSKAPAGHPQATTPTTLTARSSSTTSSQSTAAATNNTTTAAAADLRGIWIGAHKGVCSPQLSRAAVYSDAFINSRPAGACFVGALLRGGADDCGGDSPMGRCQVAPRVVVATKCQDRGGGSEGEEVEEAPTGDQRRARGSGPGNGLALVSCAGRQRFEFPSCELERWADASGAG